MQEHYLTSNCTVGTAYATGDLVYTLISGYTPITTTNATVPINVLDDSRNSHRFAV